MQHSSLTENNPAARDISNERRPKKRMAANSKKVQVHNSFSSRIKHKSYGKKEGNNSIMSQNGRDDSDFE